MNEASLKSDTTPPASLLHDLHDLHALLTGTLTSTLASSAVPEPPLLQDVIADTQVQPAAAMDELQLPHLNTPVVDAALSAPLPHDTAAAEEAALAAAVEDEFGAWQSDEYRQRDEQRQLDEEYSAEKEYSSDENLDEDEIDWDIYAEDVFAEGMQLTPLEIARAARMESLAQEFAPHLQMPPEASYDEPTSMLMNSLTEHLDTQLASLRASLLAELRMHVQHLLGDNQVGDKQVTDEQVGDGQGDL